MAPSGRWRGFRRHAPHSLVDPPLEAAALQAGTVEIVYPGTLSLLRVEVIEFGHGAVFLCVVVVEWFEVVDQGHRPAGHVLGRETRTAASTSCSRPGPRLRK